MIFMAVTAVLCVYACPTLASDHPYYIGGERSRAHRHPYIGLATMARAPADASKNYSISLSTFT